jgi:crotonobetaine/carnitine-CoA ligase
MIDLTNPRSVSAIPALADILRAGAQATPNAPMILFEDGTAWTWAEGYEATLRTAATLRARGLKKGDRLALMLQNGRPILQLWWAAAALGIVIAPLNNALRGRMLAHVCTVADAALIAVEPEFRDRFNSLELFPLDRIVGPEIADSPVDAPLRWEDLPALSNFEPHALIFTSGTTGPSKASVASFAQLLTTANWEIGAGPLTREDRFLVDLPMCHLAGLSSVLVMLSIGGSAAIRRAPAMSRYWEVAAETGSTLAVIVGTMAEFLLTRPIAESDRQHSMRLVLSSPLPSKASEFRERFGLQGFLSAYGLSEANVAIRMELTAAPRPGTCGTVRPGFEVRLVDERDFPVETGQLGEAIIRCQTPWVMQLGYFNDPAGTAHAWRNGWFHTGDQMRQDEDGYFFFHDRSKDALRRRGENISSFEVERDVMSHPHVLEAACVPVKAAGGGDDEVKVFVVPREGAALDFEDLHRYLTAQMPHFMVPRYYEPIGELPKTPSARVRKFELRERGNGPRTWDCEAAGLRVTRSGIAEHPIRREGGWESQDPLAPGRPLASSRV